MRIANGLVALVLGFSVTCGGSAGAQTLRIGLQEDPDRLDPAQSATFVGRIVLQPFAISLSILMPSLTTFRSLRRSGPGVLMASR
jgi:peptide/nickel transport system substrate-binding protein